MSLRDAIEATSGLGPSRCKVITVMSLLDDDDRETLAELIVDDMVTSTRIVSALRSIGHQMSSASMQRHRRGACGCQH